MEDKELETIDFCDLSAKLDEIIDPKENYLDQRIKVINILKNTKISREDFEPYKFINPEKMYTRNLVIETEKYNIIFLVWNPNKASPIHDHPCNGCWVRVLENTVREEIFEESGNDSL